jgi:hypothetical protein
MARSHSQTAERVEASKLRVLRSGRAKYVLSAGATTTACCTAIAIVASDAGVSGSQLGSWLRAIAVTIERGDKDFHGLLD